METMREVNLELSMPLAADAVRRLTFEVHHSKALHLSLIHI